MHDHDVLQPIPDIFLPLVADTDAQIFLKIKAVIHCVMRKVLSEFTSLKFKRINCRQINW